MRSWIERLPERVRYELSEFERLCSGFAPDALELQGGRLVVKGTLAYEGRDMALEVVYPDSFPYMRPEVYAPGLQLGRHQNPFARNLCLLDRSSRAWNTSDTGAWLVTERVPLLLGLLASGGDALRAAEAPQGEPVTSYLAAHNGAAVFVPAEALSVPATATSGTLRLAAGARQTMTMGVRAAVLELAQTRGTGPGWRTAIAPGPLRARFDGHPLRGTWLRLPTLPASQKPRVLLQSARTVDARAAEAPWQRVADGEVTILGLLVAEEVRQGETEDAWLFVVRWRRATGRSREEGAYALRGERLVAADLRARIPELETLARKSVALAGVGSLGAPLAMELARAQLGELRMLDFDAVEAGNIVRWPFGLSAVGHVKSAFLTGVISQEYPFTQTTGYQLLVGAADRAREPDTLSESAILSRFLDGADLLIDATAEIGVGQLLAALAADAGISLLSVWATEGGWGGAVAQIASGRPGTGCWYCLQLRLADGSLPAPPAETGGSVQPRGCATPTFTGSSFELLELVTQAARSTCRALLDPGEESLLHVCELRDSTGREHPTPRWTSHVLAAHPSCPCCALAQAAA